MITNKEKLDLINLRLSFWQERLQESNNAIPMLNNLRNQIKIDSNLLDIDNYSKVILALEQEKTVLTNQD
jgi:hypothetical protein